MASFSPFTGEEALKGNSTRKVPSGVIVDRSCRVYITEIPTSRIEKEGENAMRSDFEAFGPVESYRMFTEKSGRFIGSALCTYRNPADADAAVEAMNDKVVEDDAQLKVSISKDHGVILLHQDRFGHTREERSHFYRGSAAVTDNEKWSHDRFELLAQGKEINEVLGIRPQLKRGRGGRGRGFNRRDPIHEAFEQYIQERDRDNAKGKAEEESS